MPSRMIVLSIALAALAASPALAQNPATKSGVPQFQVDALWPKELPNNWLLGQVSGITTDHCLLPPPEVAVRQADLRKHSGDLSVIAHQGDASA